MAKPVLSAFADEYTNDLIGQLEALRSFGIDYLELRHADGKNVSQMTYDDITEVKQKLQVYGIRAGAIGSPLGKIPIDGDLHAHMELVRRVCETAARLESSYVRMFSFYRPSGMSREDVFAQVVDALGQMLEIADGFGVVMCHENEAKIWGQSPEQCKQLLDTFGGRMRAVFDMGNFVLGGYAPYDAYALLQQNIAYFHIKDALYRGAIVPAGLGEAQIGEILTAHTKCAENDFFVSLEPHLETFAGLNALTDVTFENPYKYPDQKTAFADAVEKLQEVIGGIQ